MESQTLKTPKPVPLTAPFHTSVRQGQRANGRFPVERTSPASRWHLILEDDALLIHKLRNGRRPSGRPAWGQPEETEPKLPEQRTKRFKRAEVCVGARFALASCSLLTWHNWTLSVK